MEVAEIAQAGVVKSSTSMSESSSEVIFSEFAIFRKN
jgi:hypothetical protein